MEKITNEKPLAFSSEFLTITVKYGLVLIGAIGTFLGMAGDFTEGNDFLKTWVVQHASDVVVFLHLILIGIIIGPARIRPLNTHVRNKNIKNSAQCINLFFLNSWTMIWASFGILYLIYVYERVEQQQTGEININSMVYKYRILEEIIRNFCQVSTTFFIFLCAAFLNPSFIRSFTELKNDSTIKGTSWWEYYKKAPNYLWRHLGILFLVLFVYHGVSYLEFVWTEYNIPQELYFTIPLMASAISIGILAGRLDNPFIANWHWVIVLLYFYGTMQVFGNLSQIGTPPYNDAIIYYSAFTLKCVWFVFVSDLFANKRILYYAYESVRPIQEKKL